MRSTSLPIKIPLMALAAGLSLACYLWPAGECQAFGAESDASGEPGSAYLKPDIKASLKELQQAIAEPAPDNQEATDRPPLLAKDGMRIAQTGTPPAASPQVRRAVHHGLSKFKANDHLPPEPAGDHKANSVLHVPMIMIGNLIAIANLQPLELDARFSVPMTLTEALRYALSNSLPIKISHESFVYQQWQLGGATISALPVPNFSTGYSFTRSKTLPDTIETSKQFPVSVRYPVFQGGAVVYAALSQYYRERGWRQSYYGSVNDALLDVYQKYNNLLLQHALLRVRVKSVAVSEAQLRLNNAQYRSGAAAELPIMQSRTQLAADRQSLIDEQVAVRQAALALTFALNMPMAINIVPAQLNLQEAQIVDADQPADTWWQVALQSRPDLRQYEMFKLAAARNVPATAASLYPQLAFTTAYTESKTVITPPGGTVGGVGVASITAAQSGLGTASANALGQTASFSPTSSTTANSGINNTVATQLVAASGGQPLNVVQSGSLVTSGAASPSFISSGSGGGSSPNINGSNAPGPGVFGGSVKTFQGVFGATWTLTNLGLNTIFSTAAAQTLVKQASLQSNQELLLVGEQIRGDYCNLVAAKGRIDNAALAVASAAESLRLSNLRMVAGTGTNLESIQAQRDYINAIVTQAQSIITSNIAQAQMLHDTGIITVDRLTAGSDYQGDKGQRQAP